MLMLMYKHIIIASLFIFVCFNCFSQPTGFKPLADETAFRKKISTTAQSTLTIKSNFVQEKNIQVVSEKIISKGTFKFKKQNKVRMEYLQPYRYLLIINNDKVSIKDEQKTNSFSSKSNKLFTIINNIIIDCVQGTAMNNKNFTASVFSNDKNYLMILTPVKKDLGDFFKNISVYMDIKDGTVSKIDMLEPSGDNTVIIFTDKEINVSIPDAEFSTN